MEQQEIQYYYELILTIIDYLIALALILVGHKRHWRWLIVDREIEKKDFIIQCIPLAAFQFAFALLQKNEALFSGEFVLIYYSMFCIIWALVKAFTICAMLQRGNKIVGGSLHVKAIVGMIIILDITDLLKAKYFFAACIYLYFAKDKKAAICVERA